MGKSLNSLLGFTIMVVLLSCKSTILYESEKIVNELETNSYKYNYRNNSERSKLFIDSLYKEFYNSKAQINTFLKKEKIKNFLFEESFYFNSTMGGYDYISSIFTKDSVYTFRFRHKIEKENLFSVNSNKCIYITFTKDSLIINRHTLYDFPKEKNSCLKENIFPSYTSFYRNGKLKLLMKKDSVIYQKKKNKIMIDLDTSIYTYDSGKICKEKNGVFHCNNGSIEKCDIDSLGYFFNCKIIKQGE